MREAIWQYVRQWLTSAHDYHKRPGIAIIANPSVWSRMLITGTQLQPMGIVHTTARVSVARQQAGEYI